MAINKYLDISTGHLTDETLRNLAHHVISEYDYGCFIFVPDEIDDECPPDLIAVIEYAKKEGCTIIRFDRDGDEIDALPIFDRRAQPFTLYSE